MTTEWKGRRTSTCAALGACACLLLSAPSRADAGSGVGLGLGYAHGGEQLLTAEFEGDVESQSIYAGSGVLFALQAMWSPDGLSTEHVLVGPRAAIGVKLAEIVAANGKIQLCRFPFDLGAHALVHLDGQTYGLLALGATYEMSPALTGTKDFAALDVVGDSVLGAYAEVGVNHVAGVALEIVVRYTHIDLPLPGITLEANSIGGMVRFYF